MNVFQTNSAFWLRLLGEAVLGALATKPMTVLMEQADAARVSSRRSSMPPRTITSEVLRGVGIKRHLDEKQRRQATMASHYGYGAAMGAAYGSLLLPRTSWQGHVARGAAFGLAVWAVSYLGWLPAIGSRAGAHRQPAKNNATILLAHLVWGASLGLLDASLAAAMPARRQTSAAKSPPIH